MIEFKAGAVVDTDNGFVGVMITETREITEPDRAPYLRCRLELGGRSLGWWNVNRLTPHEPSESDDDVVTRLRAWLTQSHLVLACDVTVAKADLVYLLDEIEVLRGN